MTSAFSSSEPAPTNPADKDDDKWFVRLEECLQRTEFVERLAACRNQPEEELNGTKIEEEEDYVVVSREDALQEMANVIAACIVQCPEARDLTPLQLQEAIIKACKDLKKSKAQSCWGWVKFIYRAASWSYTGFQLYANPWVVLAILRAMWMFPQSFLLSFFR